ncbi:MAG: hypothetical protein IKR09_08655 [Alphaproteobacteria bacterium]|nr:hypothetical protein [Alphaproteobacteria bacterium]
MEYIHVKRARKKGKKHSHSSQNIPVQNTGDNSNIANAPLPRDFEIAFKWVPVAGKRLSSEENRAVYEEYKEVRAQLLKDTVYNPDGSENKEGIARLRQAGLSDDAIYKTIGQGRTPNGYNYHHLFPRALSGSFNEGPVQFGDEILTTIHDWRCMMPLPCSSRNDIHANVHKAMEERNGALPNGRRSLSYYIAMPLTSKEYEMYKQNPKSVKAELLIVGGDFYRTEDQREKTENNKTLSVVDMACLKKANGR